MPFVRKKRERGPGGYSEYFYLVENRRQDGKVKQVVLAYLGNYKTVAEAWWKAEDEIRECSDRLSWIDAKLAQKDGHGLSLNLERDRIGRKIERLRRRIEIYERYSDGPSMPDDERRFRERLAAQRAVRQGGG